jgi:glutamate-ammonia-ligase adenylyltransferase
VGPLPALGDHAGLDHWLDLQGFLDRDRLRHDLLGLVQRARPEAAGTLWRQLLELLPACPDPAMGVRNLEAFVAASAAPSTVLEHFAGSKQATETMLQLCGTSQYFSDLLIRDPELFDWLRHAARRSAREELVDQLDRELASAGSDLDQGRDILRRFRHREMLRIGYDDIIRGATLEETVGDLSRLAEACIEGATRLARRHWEQRAGTPLEDDRTPARFVVLALGKLGGEELNYSSDVDLLFLCGSEGVLAEDATTSAHAFFTRVASEIIRLLSDHTPLGQAYRVDIRLRPEGSQGALVRTLPSAIGYYLTHGRTWERQALVKCRPVAGDLTLGQEFLAAIQPFVFRRYLGAAEIAEIKAIKRRIEQRTLSAGDDAFEVKTGRGGIRDVEFVAQFLQLLHGGMDPSVRHHNTLEALGRLEHAGCITSDERAVMDQTYRFLRKIEHRLQTLFNRQTHQMPRDREEQRRLALRMGYSLASPWENRNGPAERFLADYRGMTDRNRRILNHLLHDAFRGASETDPIVDLVLDPAVTPAQAAEVLSTFPFQDPHRAGKLLLALAQEDIPFLSQTRCRHFLAAIAPELLRAIARTPDPDQTLIHLEEVSSSLGAKGMLWELFSLNPPSLRLYVELCASSQFLSDLLKNNPGMIDELMDSLVADRPKSRSELDTELSLLCRGAADLEPILLGFRNSEFLRIGTRDILQREPVREVARELADVAGAIVSTIADFQYHKLVKRYGVPARGSDGEPASWMIAALGKLGGRELSYHGDLDLVFLYDEPGCTRPEAGGEASISNDQFFGEFARHVIRALEHPSVLYKVDLRLRPEGASGPLATSLDRLRGYLRQRMSHWERLALCRARALASPDAAFARRVEAEIRQALCKPLDAASLRSSVVELRRKLSDANSPHDLKRAPGGQITLEFLLHYLQLIHAASYPNVLVPNTWDALDALKQDRLLAPAAHKALIEAYDFARRLEGRLRLSQNHAENELPQGVIERARLARSLGLEEDDPERAAEHLIALAARHKGIVNRLFEHCVVNGEPAEAFTFETDEHRQPPHHGQK